MKNLSTRHIQMLIAMSHTTLNVRAARRAGDYASNGGTRRGLKKLKALGYIKGGFSIPGRATAAFTITEAGREALSDD